MMSAHTIKKIFSYVIFSLLISGVCYAGECSSLSSLQRKQESTIRIGMTSLPIDIDPIAMWNYQHFLISQSIFRNLVSKDQDSNLTGDIASSWKIDSTRMKYTFLIDEKIYYQDGTPVRAKDVAYSISRHFWPESKSIYAAYLKSVIVGSDSAKAGDILSGIKVSSNTTVEINIVKPMGQFLDILALPGFGIIKDDHSPQGDKIGSGKMKYTKIDEKCLLLEPVTQNTRTPSKIYIKKFNVDSVVDTHDVQGEDYDVLFGWPINRIYDFPSDKYQSRPMESLAFHHFFYNLEDVSLQNQEFRKDLGVVIQSSLKSVDDKYSDYILPIFSYFPGGILPKNYYQNNIKQIEQKDFIEKWRDKLSKKTLRIVLRKDFLPSQYVSNLKTVLTNYQINFVIIEAGTAQEMVEYLLKKQYDLISGPYVADYASAEGLLEPLLSNNPYKYIDDRAGEIVDRIFSVRFEGDIHQQSKMYSDLLTTLEAQWFFVPYTRIKLPIYYSHNVTLPDTTYKYAIRLSQIGWSQ